ncbi:L-fuculose-phosphate aldolase [Gudongella sp. SC589]|jgi:L-fuculose-phosphate aldolase|uniref:L-fuculose-phosphate aldolase n=1 Tax=Gudongella sp. SC589 TaxID=3385990 RepID=UPI00390496B2
MLLGELREKVVEYGKMLLERDLTTGTGGNISIFHRESGLVVISPSGLDYMETRANDVVVMNLDGAVIDGDRKPSSEYELHRIFYQNRDDLSALVHTHSIYATTISCMNWDLPPVHYMVAVAGDNVRCADYATFGTKELAENAFRAMEDRKAVLLANHGMLAGATTVEQAFKIAEDIEFCCELYYRTRSMGEPVVIGQEEMVRMREKFRKYGQK